MRSRAALGIVSAALAVLATGCGGGAEPHAGGTPTSSAAAASTTTAPGVAPASGRLVTGKVLSYHLPAGLPWIVNDGGAFADVIDAQGEWTISYAELPALDATDAEFARQVVASMRATYGPSLRRMPDREVGGRSGVVLEARRPDKYYYAWYPVVGSTRASFRFEAPSASAKARRMIDSVLASIAWK
jgi:hypothetical protein